MGRACSQNGGRETRGKRLLGRPRRRWLENIRMDLEEIGINAANWVDSAQDRNYWRTLVNAALNLRDPSAMELVNYYKLPIDAKMIFKNIDALFLLLILLFISCKQTAEKRRDHLDDDLTLDHGLQARKFSTDCMLFICRDSRKDQKCLEIANPVGNRHQCGDNTINSIYGYTGFNLSSRDNSYLGSYLSAM